MMLVLNAQASAQQPAGAPDNPVGVPIPRAATLLAPCDTIGGFAPILPPIHQAAPRTSGEISSFIDSLSTDSTFEVLVGQSKLLVVKEDLAIAGRPRPLIAVGDPSVIDFTVVGPRQIRISGIRLGTTDLSITTADNRVYTFEAQVVADLRLLRAQLKAVFPDASLRLAQIRDHVVVEGEARDSAQVSHIIETIKAFLVSVQATEARKMTGQSVGPVGPGGGPAAGGRRSGPPPRQALPPDQGQPGTPGQEPFVPQAEAYSEQLQYSAEGVVVEPRVINLIKVPGSQQVLLKVRVAELNRTALRQIGGDFLGVDPATGAILGTQIGGAGITGNGVFTGKGVTGLASGTTSSSTTIFGILEAGHFEFLINALRSNAMLKILAEPNLVTMSGHPASFLAGGEYPVPVPQSGGGGGAPVVTVAFKEFGVRLGFVPYVLDDGVVRLTVDPEVSTINFAVGAVLVPGGTKVPGLDTRKSHTTVELRQGQTLAIAGLMQLTLDGSSTRIPILGDLPVIGPFFSNTSNTRMEKELLVLVTPYLVEPMNHCQVPPAPGEDVKEPTDLEVFFLNRIEGRTGRDYRSTTEGQQPLRKLLNVEREHLRGPSGFSECPDR